MAYHEREGKFRYRAWSGHIYVTNQRVFFRMSMTGISMVDLHLSEVEGFWVSKEKQQRAGGLCSPLVGALPDKERREAAPRFARERNTAERLK